MCAITLTFQFKTVQTWAAKKATTYLSNRLGTTVRIKSLYIKPFSLVVLEDFYVLDKQNDTLLKTPKLTVSLSSFSVFNSIQQKKLDFKSIQLDNGTVYIKRQLDSTSNFKFILDAFKSTDTVKAISKPWNIDFEKIILNNLSFRYKNALHHEAKSKQVNFGDIAITKLSVELTALDLKNHYFKAHINKLTFAEQSGFYVKNLTTDATVDSNQIALKHLYLSSRNSVIRDYFKMDFKSYDDFDDFVNKVYMDGDFKSSRISSFDAAYFTSNLQHIFFDLGVDGRIRGRVNYLRAKKLTITAGQATYIKGDFNLRGLPNWDNTFLELKFDQIATNKKDVDLLYSRFTGRANAKIPDVITKFGNINFKGQFTGLQNDFIAYGEFKTKLGRFTSDINLKIDKKGQPSYSGKINATDFDLGTLANQKIIGHTSFVSNIKGSGGKLNTILGQLNANVKYFELNGYAYNNLLVNGSFNRKKFNGTVSVNDHNLNLNFNGGVDLNPTLPLFNFTAAIKNANLHQLKLSNDSLTVSANIASNFQGNNINNIDGQILLNHITIANPKNRFLIDSVYFKATGQTDSRMITLKSDLADGDIKGNYDLATIPSYFKTIIKKYLPSFKTEITPPKPEKFTFNIQLKNVKPITTLLFPAVKIPDEGSFAGNFNSEDKTAIITGSIKTLSYKNIVFHDMLLDENTTDNRLDFNIAFSKINFSDSLFVKDINITNSLKGDDLNFNVKLSDKNAINQLDLYGLFKFRTDSTTKLLLLPSDIIIENQKWRLESQPTIDFKDGGRTQITGLSISNGSQKVNIDGVVSSSTNDMLHIGFVKFGMQNFNQLSKSEGIYLKGDLSGEVNLSSLASTPGLTSDLNIDSLLINKTPVGNVKFVTKYDIDNKLINTQLNIFNKGLETLKAFGNYNLASTDNPLDFTLQMNQTEAIIIEPFVHHLVSNLKGTLSSDLKLTGSLSKPQINGSVTLANTGLMVNYLKTQYTINEKADITNSILNITNLILDDGKGGQGIANGSIDFSQDITNPVFNIDINAQKLLALNTTFKDNRLYYGTAYGTGLFSFMGPVDNMEIDINAKTEEGTVFNIPLNTSSTASDYDFIKFVSTKDTSLNQKRTSSFKGITLNFTLSADEKTTVKIYTDYGLLTGNGNANGLALKINSLGDFEMFGDFIITTGKYEFKAKNFISKNFTVNPGGSIKWTGDPQNAQIDIKAIYQVRTDISKLYQAAGLQSPQGAQQKLVQAELSLTKSLIQPSVDFDFNFPGDPSIKDNLGTYLQDPTNRSQQALSLIVRRNFAPGTGGGNISTQVGQTAQDAVSELAFNTLNSFLSQSNFKQLDLNIRSASDASASFHLFKDRLVLNTSVYSEQGNNQLIGANQTFFNSNFSNLTKDFEAQYLIRKDGRLMATYSYRVLNATTLNTINDQLGVQYVNGIGLIYNRDFDSFGEFLKIITGRKKTVPAKTDTAKVKSTAVKPATKK